MYQSSSWRPQWEERTPCPAGPLGPPTPLSSGLHLHLQLSPAPPPASLMRMLPSCRATWGVQPTPRLKILNLTASATCLWPHKVQFRSFWGVRHGPPFWGAGGVIIPSAPGRRGEGRRGGRNCACPASPTGQSLFEPRNPAAVACGSRGSWKVSALKQGLSLSLSRPRFLRGGACGAGPSAAGR